MFLWGRYDQDSLDKRNKIQALNLPNQKIQDVALGENHLVIIDPKDQVFGYGNNTFGQLDAKIKKLEDPYCLSFNLKIRIEKVELGCDFSFLIDKDFNVGLVIGFIRWWMWVIDKLEEGCLGIFRRIYFVLLWLFGIVYCEVGYS